MIQRRRALPPQIRKNIFIIPKVTGNPIPVTDGMESGVTKFLLRGGELISTIVHSKQVPWTDAHT